MGKGWLLYGFFLLLLACTQQGEPEKESTRASVATALGSITNEGFEQALEVRSLQFPKDHGAHPSFRNEWWYITGNLTDESNRAFGYQVTFFRIGLAPESAEPVIRQSAWATRQLWMAHAAITDIDKADHREAERFSRGSPGLAGVSREPFQVWLDDWQIKGSDLETDHHFPWHLQVNSADFSLALSLSSRKPVVLQGEQGLSRKSEDPGNASYYYSFTRMATAGQITLDGKNYHVNGLSWLDREWSSGALAEGQAGWDWFSLQLQSGEEMMYYQLRDKDGVAHPFSQGSWVEESGKSRVITANDVLLTPLTWWQSSDSGKRYPVRWRLQQLSDGHDWTVEALVQDQEMMLTINYWEGAVTLIDNQSGKRIGSGYLEMTGY